MAENLDILNTAVSLLIKAALLAARCSGRVRKRSLKLLAAEDMDAKAKEIFFLKDRVYQFEMQLPGSPPIASRTPRSLYCVALALSPRAESANISNDDS